MNEPKRLLDEGASELGRAALRSALDEPPPVRLLERTLAVVGASTAIVAGAGAAHAAAAAASGGKSTVASWVWFLLKCLGAGVGGGAMLVGAMEIATPSSPPAAAARGVEMAAAAAGSSGARAAAGAPAANEPSTAAPDLHAEQPAAAQSSAPAAIRPPPATSASARTGSIAAEIALLDAANNALVGGNAARAGALLDQYAGEFPGGRLAPEAEVLRIKVLAARGDRTAAAERASRFIQQHPNSPHVEHLRAIADTSR